MGGGYSKSATWSPNKLRHTPDDIKRLSDMLKVKASHEQEVAVTGWDSYQREMHNNKMLKALFKKLDPYVMKPVGDVKGEIQLSFKYEIEHGLLLIKVIKCRDLANKDIRAKMSSFFIKLDLLPDNHGEGAKRTQTIHQTNSPRFDEIFSYLVAPAELEHGRLLVHVCEQGLGDDFDVRGEVIIDLNSLPFCSDPVHTAWYSLNLETDQSVSGELDISVVFQHPHTLLVTVYCARNLSARDHGQTADPFVKVAVAGCPSVSQTKVMKNTLNPVWNETLEFTLHEEELDNKYIIFHAIDRDTSSSNDSLGQCIVDLTNQCVESGLHGTYPLADLRNSERMRGSVHQNKVAQEFREALIAHSVARAPGCLFKNHMGNGGKIISLTCRKAGAQGKIRIVDGVPVY